MRQVPKPISGRLFGVDEATSAQAQGITSRLQAYKPQSRETTLLHIKVHSVQLIYVSAQHQQENQ
jgi:hypothetical protein